MRIIYLDIDTLRPDHLGCYGYKRNTSPNIDLIAKDGVIFTNYYCSDAPCLPSRTALITGMPGIRNGVVNHGGAASQLRINPNRNFRDELERYGLFPYLRNNGYYTVGITPFASRHSAWYYYSGFNEIYDTGKYGDELAHEVSPIAIKWLKENAKKDNWYLHINLWDPHTPYRTPLELGNDFEDDPLPSWITKEVLEEHKKMAGPHCALEIGMYTDFAPSKFPRQLGRLDTLDDVKKLYDGYDMGIKYADNHVGQIVKALKEEGIYEDTLIIISSDHGENMGELGIYAEHGCADEYTCKIPFIMKYPGGVKDVKDNNLHHNYDLLPTLADLLGFNKMDEWDGTSFANALFNKDYQKRDYLVLSQMAHVCQRSVRYKDYLYIRTYHDGFHFFPKHMLFDLKNDPYEQNNIADSHPELIDKLSSILLSWHDEMMEKNDYLEDPLSVVMREGGPFHAKGNLKHYTKHLIKTNREHYIEKYKEKHPKEFK